MLKALFGRSTPLDYTFQDDAPLMQLSRRDPWTLRDAFEGTVIFGGTGSGKTSGSGAALARSFLKAGFGGLVLCAKPTERRLWERYCQQTGRLRSLIVVDGAGDRRFNFLQYELARGGIGSGNTGNVVSLLMRILEAAQPGSGQVQGGDNPFWANAMRELLSHAIDALWAAYGHVSLHDILQMAQTAPRGDAQLKDQAWREQSFCFQTLKKAYEEPVHPMDRPTFEVVSGYWRSTFGEADNRTRSNIVSTLTATINPLLKGDLRRLFCTSTNVIPEMTHEGAILVVDLSVKQWDQAGIMAQHIFKYLWQRAAERRNVTPKSRPLFLWADECQFFVSSYDAEFQSTARSARACTVYLTQNLPGLYEKIGGRNPEHVADSLLGNFQTKIFHANSDPKTNHQAAEMVGKSLQMRGNFSDAFSRGGSHGQSGGSSWNSSYSAQGGSSGSGGNRGWSSGSSWSHNMSEGASEVIDYELQPSHFTRLRKGGSKSLWKVEGIVFQSGRVFRHTVSTWIKCAFSQR